MIIKISDKLSIDSRTLIRFEWKKFYPALIVHEKYENIVKWILRSIAFVGIALSVVSIPIWFISLGIALLILGVEKFFEKIIFEYWNRRYFAQSN